MKLLRCYIPLLVVCTIAVILAAMIPHRAIKNNCQTSIAYVVEQGEYPLAFGLPLLKIDNFTDLLMLNEAWCSDNAHPVNAAMMNYFFFPEGGNMFEASVKMINQPVGQEELTEYSRYWHGFQIVLRPLLVLTDYKTLIVINYILLTLLALWCLCNVWQHCKPSVSISLGIVLLLTAFPAVPLCFQYSVCFYIMFLFIIALLRNKTTRRQDVCSFFTVGALTAFFDLLTTPLLTLGIPLLIYMQGTTEDGRMKRSVQLSASWAAGYASLWLSKCLMAWLLTRQNVLGVFMEEAHMRSALGLNTVSRLITGHFLTCIGIAFLSAVLVVLAMRWARRCTCLRRDGWLLFVAALPLLWYAVLLQHTVIHFFFVWRMLAITLMALLLLTFNHKKPLNHEARRTYSLL